MILIYNLSGLLLGLAGAAVGILVGAATKHVSIGLLAMAMVWLVFGRRKTDAVTGAKRPFPSLFFVPLAFVAVPLVLLAVPLFVVERRAKALPPDPRTAQLDADEAQLSASRAGGDLALSEEVLKHLASVVEPGKAKVEDYSVFTSLNAEAVLVLVQVPNLKQYQDAAREQVLDLIEGMLVAEDRTKGKRVYLGVRGRVSYGAIRCPDGFTKTGAVVLRRPLYDFYGPSGPTSASATGRRD